METPQLPTQNILVTVSPIDGIKFNIQTEYNLTVLFNESDSGAYSCYIPALDIYYSADSYDEIPKLGSVLAKSFSRHWVGNNNFIRFIQQLRVLGFNPAKDIWQNVIKKKDFIKDTKFNKSLFKIPNEFKNAKNTIVAVKQTEYANS